MQGIKHRGACFLTFVNFDRDKILAAYRKVIRTDSISVTDLNSPVRL